MKTTKTTIKVTKADYIKVYALGWNKGKRL
jgi:hypothetical protein